MAFNVSTFRSAMALDGARPNLFEVQIPALTNYWVENTSGDFRFFCRAASLPGSTIGVVTVPYFGREVKLAGNRTFADWTVTVINDESFAYRSAFENWMNTINSHEENYRFDNSGYALADSAIVNQLSKTGDEDAPTIQRQYEFKNLFPIDISEITLDWGDNDSVEEFTVTFAYDYWTATTPSNANDATVGPEPITIS